MNIDRKSWTRSAAAVPVISAVKNVSDPAMNSELWTIKQTMVINRGDFHYIGATVARTRHEAYSTKNNQGYLHEV